MNEQNILQMHLGKILLILVYNLIKLVMKV
jgi:hypothetical protein